MLSRSLSSTLMRITEAESRGLSEYDRELFPSVLDDPFVEEALVLSAKGSVGIRVLSMSRSVVFEFLLLKASCTDASGWLNLG